MIDIMKPTETIRNEIRNCGKSRNRIAIDTGVDPAVLHRFINGGGLKLETAEVLLDYFGFDVERKKKGSGDGGTKAKTTG